MDSLIHLVTLACLYKFVEVVHEIYHVIYDSVPGDHVHVGLAWKLLCGHSGPVLAALKSVPVSCECCFVSELTLRLFSLTVPSPEEPFLKDGVED